MVCEDLLPTVDTTENNNNKESGDQDLNDPKKRSDPIERNQTSTPKISSNLINRTDVEYVDDNYLNLDNDVQSKELKERDDDNESLLSGTSNNNSSSSSSSSTGSFGPSDALPRLTRSQHRQLLGDTPPGSTLKTASSGLLNTGGLTKNINLNKTGSSNRTSSTKNFPINKSMISKSLTNDDRFQPEVDEISVDILKDGSSISSISDNPPIIHLNGMFFN